MKVKREHKEDHSVYFNEYQMKKKSADKYAVDSMHFWNNLSVDEIENFTAATGAALYIGQTSIAGLPLLMFVCDKEVPDEHFTFV